MRPNQLSLNPSGEMKPLITFGAFVYFFGDVEKENIIGPFTLGTSGQVFDELDFITINGHFG
jgi:hypothetical protein